MFGDLFGPKEWFMKIGAGVCVYLESSYQQISKTKKLEPSNFIYKCQVSVQMRIPGFDENQKTGNELLAKSCLIKV